MYNVQTIVAKEVILQLPISSALLVCRGQVQEELLKVQNPALSFFWLWTSPASILLKVEKTKPRVPLRIQNEQQSIEENIARIANAVQCHS